MNYHQYKTQPDTGPTTGNGLPIGPSTPRPSENSLALNRFRKQVEAALEYAGESHRFEDVVEQVAAGQLQFWPGPASLIVTEIIEHPRNKVLHFFLAAGIQSELAAMAPLILEWGKLKGCSKAAMLGRKGWQRSFLADTGWITSDLVIMEKPL
jgi:hypothetical protein